MHIDITGLLSTMHPCCHFDFTPKNFWDPIGRRTETRTETMCKFEPLKKSIQIVRSGVKGERREL